jgi:hypothetical protein
MQLRPWMPVYLHMLCLCLTCHWCAVSSRPMRLGNGIWGSHVPFPCNITHAPWILSGAHLSGPFASRAPAHRWGGMLLCQPKARPAFLRPTYHATYLVGALTKCAMMIWVRAC